MKHTALALTTELASIATDLLILGCFTEGKKWAASDVSFNQNPTLLSLHKSNDIASTLYQTTLLRQVPGIVASRLLFVGLGARSDWKKNEGKNHLSRLAILHQKILQELKQDYQKITMALPYDLLLGHEKAGVDTNGNNAVWEAAVGQWAIDSECAHYHFQETKNTSKKAVQKTPHLCQTMVPAAQLKRAKIALDQGLAIAEGIALTKNLGNLAPNYCTPTYLGESAKNLAKSHGLQVDVLGEKKIAALKMNSFLAVAQGAEQTPRLITLHYKGGNKTAAPIVLVGKGITFDSGGISLKPGLNMDEMKYDMCGAGTVLGVIHAVATMKLPINVIGVIPACENMPSGRATKPGDIVTSMSGQTIEVLNTDAEGRLILCDALTFVERFKPRLVIDIATLTGACVVALGHHHSGLFTRDDATHEAFAQTLIAAGKASNDTVWQMPLDDAYQTQLDSNFADIANIGGMPAGSVTAACFLARFTKNYPWMHLDIAGTAWKSGKEKGATGRPVRLLVEFLRQTVGVTAK